MTETDYLCERRLAQLNPFYHTLIKNAVVVFNCALEKYKLYFPDFTDHTLLHSMQVLDFCNTLLGENALELNEDELYVLIMSAYLHDSGMGISEADYKSLYETVVSPDYKLSHPHDNVHQTIRAFHQAFSKQLVYKYADLFEIPTPQHAMAIAAISEAHRRVDLYDQALLPSVLEIPGHQSVRLPYLAALLRLADELDIAADRNLCTAQTDCDTIFKMMHRAIRRLHILPDRFVLDVDADDPALYDSIQKETAKLAETLQTCVDVVAKRTPFRISQTKLELHRLHTEKKHITVLDTDLGTDDAVALLLLKILPVQPDIIVTSYGNTSLSQANKNAVILKKYLELGATVVSGLPAPADAPAEKNTFHGHDGLADCSQQMIDRLQLTDTDFETVLPFENLRDLLQQADTVTYITIGALSNLCCLLQDTALCKKLAGIYVMGGGIREFNCAHDTEFNFSKDPTAVQKLLSSGLNITLFPLDVTNHQQLNTEDIDTLEAIGSYPEYIRFLRHNLQSNTLLDDIPAAVLHDTLPVLYLSCPEQFTLQDTRLIADEYGHTEISGEGTALHLCTGVKPGLVKDAVRQAFLQRSLLELHYPAGTELKK